MTKSVLLIPSLGELDEQAIHRLRAYTPRDWVFSIFKEPFPEVYAAPVTELPSLLLQRKGIIQSFFKASKPDLIVITQYFHPGILQILEIAKQFGIPSLYLVPEIYPEVQRNLSAESFFDKDELKYLHSLGISYVPDVDYICTWSVRQRDELLSIFKDSSIYVTGHPLLDIFKNNYNTDSKSELHSKLQIPKDAFLVSFFLDYDSVTELGSNMEKIESSLLASDKYMYVRNFSNRSLASLSTSRVIIEDESSNKYQINYLDAIKYSSTFISGHNEFLIYSVLFGKTPILFDPFETDPMKLVESGGVTLTTSFNRMLETISNLQVAPKQDLDPHQLNFFLLNFLPCTLDESNSKRVLLVMDLAIRCSETKKSTEKAMLGIFNEKFEYLLDPLHKEKELVNRTLEGREV